MNSEYLHNTENRSWVVVVLIKNVLTLGIIILTLATVPCICVLMHAEKILVFCGQDPEIAYLTGHYLLITLPALMVSIIIKNDNDYCCFSIRSWSLGWDNKMYYYGPLKMSFGAAESNTSAFMVFCHARIWKSHVI